MRPWRRKAAKGDVYSGASLDRRFWYVENLFFYTNELMERTQTRCNYLIFANSVAAVAFSTITNALLSNRGSGHHVLSRSTAILVALLPSAIFLVSLVLAVTAFLPRIYDYKIEINQSFIAKMPLKSYRQLVANKSEDSRLTDFVDEIHVLSRILDDRTKRVDMAARLFIGAVVTMLVAIGGTAL